MEALAEAPCPACGKHVLKATRANLLDCAGCRAEFVAPGATVVPLRTRSGGTLSGTSAPSAQAEVALPPEFLAEFALGRVLGCGSMGMVFQAVDRATGRTVAVKVMLRVDDQDLLDRFLLEGKSLARANHPGVMGIYRVGALAGHPYLVTEYLGGGTLRELMDAEGALPPKRAVPILAACLDGIDACHRAGIVHRDLKPENILFTESGEPRIADLGVAKVYSGGANLTSSGTVLGTPLYMAPEQVRGESAGAAADIYAMGLIAYEMLAGRRPFEAANLADIFEAQLRATPPPLASHGVNASLAAAVHAALAKPIADRPPTAQDFAERLRRTLAKKSARPLSPPPARWTPTLPIALAAGCALLVGLTAAMALSTTACGPGPQLHTHPYREPALRNYEPDVRTTCAQTARVATSKANFHERWYLLDNWIKQLTMTRKKAPFDASDLVSIRINFYRDEAEASVLVDKLYARALVHLGNTPAH